ncbi:MAG: [Fe-Fe] hydrogenase large subunit C-terminal domain-containing protein, partial [Oscillospiraceae bacterium]|nr:[Fe-Fe] hydrogenase large subunit C-terminal domain-containing protein [Oscillospiraceae bacterium]
MERTVKMELLQFDELNCKNCYKCVRHCPVKAIEVKNHRAQIRADECILCGECTIVCPQKTKEPVSEMTELQEALKDGKKIIASVAPSFFAYYGVPFDAFREGLMKLGFSDVFETAEGAYLVKSQYEDLIANTQNQVWISSCCSSVNLLITKYHTEVLKNLAPVLTPIQAHARLLKERFPDAMIAFVTPCISKKAERYEADSQLDFSVSFEEMQAMLDQEKIQLDNAPDEEERKYLSRSFPMDGGIVATMAKAEGYHYVSVSGYEACVQAIRDIQKGKIKSCFVEMSLCEGSCIGGPIFRKRQQSLLGGSLEVQKYANVSDYSEDFNIQDVPVMQKTFSSVHRVIHLPPSEEQLVATLHKMGKYSQKDELNCGMCGYPSCREKAAAILEGKAEINMCLPFMHERAESFSNQILEITPDAILSVDSDLKIQQINQAACDIFRVTSGDVLYQPVSRVLDEFSFVDIMMNGTPKVEKTAFLADYHVYLNQTFLYDKESGRVVCIMKNISADRQKRNVSMKKKVQAAAMADE